MNKEEIKIKLICDICCEIIEEDNYYNIYHNKCLKKHLINRIEYKQNEIIDLFDVLKNIIDN